MTQVRNYENISPTELAARLEGESRARLIDVREHEEYEIARIERAELLPLSRFREWAGALDPDDEIVVMCHHGVRSAHVCAVLAEAGFKKLLNLAGGIDAWSTEVDANVPRY